ncbi:MAG TPA: hypothetical protein VE986_04375 [Hyphomicrobiales bacterium]|nr:hypothetical protein [Hyphomicrobiales bacterium]
MGAGHLNVAFRLLSLAEFIAARRPEEARSLYARALRIFKDKLLEDHPLIGATEEALARLDAL